MPVRNVLFGVLALLIFCGANNGRAADQWTQFRGSNFDGVVAIECPETWDETKNVRWKLPLEGEGWSCPVIWNDRVFLTAAIRTDEQKADEAEEVADEPEQADGERRGRRGRGGRGRGGRGRYGNNLTEANYRWDVICLDAKTGDTVWRETARTGHPTIERHSSNTYATETPVTDGTRVYAYFGMNGLFCYDMEGKPLWEKDLGAYEMRAGWGTSSSPILFEDRLYLQIDNEEQSFLVALDSETGDELWRVDRDEPSQYSTPIIWKNSRRNELIAGGQTYRSYDPATGKLLWQLDMSKGRSSATPLAVGDSLFVGTELRNRGGDDDGGGFLFSVKPGGTGNITPDEGASSSEFVAWKIDRSRLEMASPVYCQGLLYLLERRGGTLHCVGAETGETAYRSRIPGARGFWASPWTCGEKVFCLDDSGTTHVIAAGPEFELLGTNVIDEPAWSSPAVAGDAVYLRTTRHLYCIAK